jgi:ubiquinone/menaquinone biosynthesis C-methylase UbiE
MADHDVLLAGEYFLAVAGLALMRAAVVDPAATRERVADVRQIVEHFDEFPQSLRFEVHPHDIQPGYTQWAPKYDGPNPAIDTEEPVVHEFLAGAPRGTALDAACGTGRHAAHLAKLGYRVIGVDATKAMLDVAMAKVPAAEFRTGRLDQLPVEDASVDVVTCSLALTHVEDLRPVMAEFARVLRPGGWLVTSDMHPVIALLSGTGGAAVFPTDADGELHYVVNRLHPHAEYIDAFNGAGLRVQRCAEPRFAPAAIERLPSSAAYPETTKAAFDGLPYVLVWLATKPD